MIQIKFKNLDRSAMARDAVTERIQGIVDKFPDLDTAKIHVTLEMENSPVQAGPDQFKVKLHVTSGRFKGIVIEKGHPNMYVALADVADRMLEKLNRFGDKARVKARKSARQLAKELSEGHDALEDKMERKIG